MTFPQTVIYGGVFDIKLPEKVSMIFQVVDFHIFEAPERIFSIPVQIRLSIPMFATRDRSDSTSYYILRFLFRA